MSTHAEENKPGSSKPTTLMLLFTLTIFLSASLLFFVQPLFAKLVLPRLGGSPAVWTTAMLFFQTVLIAGYVYAHLITKYLPNRLQAGVHLALWASALIFIPLSISDGWNADPTGSITIQTLWVFAVGVGVPFAFLSANAPLIQYWYGQSGGPNANDPYFLYGASNLGSMGALLAFPLIAEPLWGATAIGYGWAAGFIALGILLGICGFASGKSAHAVDQDIEENSGRSQRLHASDYLWWLLLAFVPSSLMLSITAFISSDLGSFPLLWVIPLSLYLLTFVLAFKQNRLLSNKLLERVVVVSIALMALASLMRSFPSFFVPLLFVMFFAVTLYAHGLLYDRRPDKQHLTMFYVVMSFGGALGGVFNSLIAPTFFSGLYEIKLTIVVASLLLTAALSTETIKSQVKMGTLAGLIITFIIVMGLLLGLDLNLITLFLVYCSILALFSRNAIALCTTTVVFIVSATLTDDTDIIHRSRSFFGLHKIFNDGETRVYTNGTTIHGKQLLSEFQSSRPTPLSYYYTEGTFGQIFSSKTAEGFKDIGIIGLGAGALACYSKPSQNWHFYEIDEAVVRIAKNKDFFTYMSTCGNDAPIHLGDARIVLERQNDTKFDLLVVDAFSSDAIPVHILTEEAISLYMSHLKPEGILFIHISNRYFDLLPPIARSAEKLGIEARAQKHYVEEKSNPDNLFDSSSAVILSRTKSALSEFDNESVWEIVESDGKAPWTDDFANVLSALR